MTYQGNCRLGDLFTSRREKGRPGLPTLSVTQSDGLVDRTDLDRKQETNLAPEEHLLVKPGDIAYNMMRMWQGAFGLATHEGLVSPAYVVLTPTSKIHSEFASFLFSTKRLTYLFWAYSHGITDDRLRLYYDDFAKIPVTIPPLETQRKIVATLTAWDRAISSANRLLDTELKMYKQALRDLTTGSRRIVGFAEKWRTFKLSSLGSTYGGLSGKSAEHFGRGKAYIPYKNIFENTRVDPENLDYVDLAPNENQNSCQRGDIFFTSSSETANEVGTSSVLLDDIGEVYLNSFCIGFRLKNFQNLTPEFARYLFRGPRFRKSLYRLAQGYTRYNLSKTSLVKVPVMVPPLNEQIAISKILTCYEARLSRLHQNIQSLKAEQLAISSRILASERLELLVSD